MQAALKQSSIRRRLGEPYSTLHAAIGFVNSHDLYIPPPQGFLGDSDSDSDDLPVVTPLGGGHEFDQDDKEDFDFYTS